MAGIPVATLRVWERRYAVVGPVRAASGQRLYAPHDVERLVLIKRLVDLGHAIGTIATAPVAALRSLAAVRSGGQVEAPAATARLALVVVGRTLARRMSSGGGERAVAWAGASITASFGDLAHATAALAALPALGPSAGHRLAGAPPLAADAVLVQVASLQPDVAEQVLRLADGWPSAAHVPRVVVIYGFAPEPVLQHLRDGGVELHRAPLSTHDLHALLVRAAAACGTRLPAAVLRSPAPPQRFDDDALAHFAAISSTVACECPRHVAEIVMQLSAFETYSADCTQSSPADAQLHAYLADVAGSARALFEQALERIALAEGLALPLARECAA